MPPPSAAANSAPVNVKSPPEVNAHGKRPKRRHHHKKRGKFVVLAVVLLVAAYVSLALFFSIKGFSHPLIANWGYVTQLIIHSLFAAVVFLCLFRFYRGSLSVKQVMGAAGTLATGAYAILITTNFLSGDLTSWFVLDASGLAISIFVAWVCFFSRGAASFMNYQQDH